MENSQEKNPNNGNPVNSTAIAEIEIKSKTAFVGGRRPDTEREKGARIRPYEEENWQDKLHYDPETKEVYIPVISFYNAFNEAKEKVFELNKISCDAGRFQFGFSEDKMLLGFPFDDIERIEKISIFAPVSGKHGGQGRKAPKIFPSIKDWGGKFSIQLFFEPDEIGCDPQKLFKEIIAYAGLRVGIGAMRIANGGMSGAFTAKVINWVVSEQ